MTQSEARQDLRSQAPGLLQVPVAKGFVTIVGSTIALIILCFLFAPSAISQGALVGSLPFAAVLAIVGLGQMLVVQQGGFDLSVPGGVSLAVVVATHIRFSAGPIFPAPSICPLACRRMSRRRQ